MKIRLTVNYKAEWGQILFVTGNAPLLGSGNLWQAKEMICVSGNKWFIEFDVEEETDLTYNYFVKEGEKVVRKEFQAPHFLSIAKGKDYLVEDVWYDTPKQSYFNSSAFTDVFFAHPISKEYSTYSETLLLTVFCPAVAQDEELVLCGSIEVLGNWKPEKAPRMHHVGQGAWQLSLNVQELKGGFEYKLVVCDRQTREAKRWEAGENRYSNGSYMLSQHTVRVETLVFELDWLSWKAAGVAIPVFSLRSDDSFGVGEFSDLKKLADWGALTGLKVIQLLPINDTTLTRTWIDSYPYNAISTYALHPIYLGLKQLPLDDKQKNKEYIQEAGQLNALRTVDYEKVFDLKCRYLNALYEERSQKVFRTKLYKNFYKQNEHWLFPYACYSYLRDSNQSGDHHIWGDYATYNKEKLEKLISSKTSVRKQVGWYFFVQYLLHQQLSDSCEYIHKKGLLLKGDIPIGVSANSVEAWVEPHLFNLDKQTGAPPDDFSVYGQNWEFPTYNWEEMAKDGYEWWKRRFRKMADYFDAYRIDHILGFFRIWEIPQSSLQALLGYFSPALPFTEEELQGRGLWLDNERMTHPYIHDRYLYDIFGEYKQEVVHAYLHSIAYDRYELNRECNTQRKVQALFEGRTDDKSNKIREGLYLLCNEVLFVNDAKNPHRLHPRIAAQHTYSYRDLQEDEKEAFNRLYDHFFYERHNRFWRDSAMQKLPGLIDSTRMLVCGEDLGMIPDSVPEVMRELQVLSLEVERMPKSKEVLFTQLDQVPYASVCTTSTHDISTIRLWWKEDKSLTQLYYNQILGRVGEAPEECSVELCKQIIMNHLSSPAMLAILPLQDWLALDVTSRNPHADEERINVPSNPHHYWRYRMHLSLEKLLQSENLNREMQQVLQQGKRM